MIWLLPEMPAPLFANLSIIASFTPFAPASTSFLAGCTPSNYIFLHKPGYQALGLLYSINSLWHFEVRFKSWFWDYQGKQQYENRKNHPKTPIKNTNISLLQSIFYGSIFISANQSIFSLYCLFSWLKQAANPERSTRWSMFYEYFILFSKILSALQPFWYLSRRR